jgi:hypothetical protein
LINELQGKTAGTGPDGSPTLGSAGRRADLG